MPPVQIPSLSQAPVDDQASVGRVDFKPVNTLPDQQMVSKSAEGLAGAAATYIQREQINQADTIANAGAAEYHQWNQSRLYGPNGVSSTQGDPSDAFDKYHQDAKDKKDEIMGRYADASTMVKNAIQSKLYQTDNRFSDKVTTLNGKMSSSFEANTVNANVENNKNDARTAVASVNPDRPESTAGLDQLLASNADLRMTSAQKTGLAVQAKDENGDPVLDNTGQPSYHYSPSVNNQIAKDNSDMLSKAILNLSATGGDDNIAKAKFLMDKYGDQILPGVDTKTRDILEKQATQQTGYNAFGKVMNLPEDAAMDKLKNDDSLTPQEKLAAVEHLGAFHSVMNRGIKQQQNDNYQQASSAIYAQQNTANPYTTKQQVLDDPVFKRTSSNMTPKQQDAIINSVVRPKVTNSDVADHLSTIVEDPTQGWTSIKSRSDFDLLNSGLNTKDYNRNLIQWQNSNNPSTASQVRAQTQMLPDLKQQMIATGLIKPGYNNQLGSDDQKTLIDMKNKFTDYTQSTNLAEMNPEKRLQLLKQFVADPVKQKIFSPPPVAAPAIAPAPAKNPTTSNIPGVQAPQTLLDQKKVAMKAWIRAGNSPDPTSPAFQKFMKDGNY